MDPISNMLVSIKNAQAVNRETVKIPYSNLKFEIAKILERLSFIEKVEKGGKNPKRYLEIYLKYDENGKGVISFLKRISKPGQRIYINYDRIRIRPKIYQIVSTSKGLMIDREAKKNKLGGEILFEIR